MDIRITGNQAVEYQTIRIPGKKQIQTDILITRYPLPDSLIR